MKQSVSEWVTSH